MQKHVHYWLGVFTAGVVIVAIAIGAWSVATERALSLVAIAVGAIVALTVVLVLTLTFRRMIFSRFLGVSEASVERITLDTSSLVASTLRGDLEGSQRASQSLAGSLVGWWAWSSFYRWVIGTNLAFLVAFGGFAGTVLLFEQNKRLEEQNTRLSEQTIELQAQRRQLEAQIERFDLQNDLMALNVVAELRSRLENTTGQSPSWDDDLTSGFVSSRMDEVAQQVSAISAGCAFESRQVEMHRGPNPSEVIAISGLAESERLRLAVVNAMLSLTHDQDMNVRLGAVLVLDHLAELPSDLEVSLSGMYVTDLKLQSESGIKLSFERSIIDGLWCRNCEVQVSNSMLISILGAKPVSGVDSIITAGNLDDVLPTVDGTTIEGSSELLFWAGQETELGPILRSVVIGKFFTIMNDVDFERFSGLYSSRADYSSYSSGIDSLEILHPDCRLASDLSKAMPFVQSSNAD